MDASKNLVSRLSFRGHTLRSPKLQRKVSTFTSMWMLHIGTYYYVLQMDQFESSMALTAVGQQNAKAQQNGTSAVLLSPGLTPDAISTTSCKDCVLSKTLRFLVIVNMYSPLKE